MAPQPRGAVTRARLKKAGIQDEDLIKTQVQVMRMHEAPFFHGCLLNNAFPACTHGLKGHLIQPTNRKESTAKQELHQLDSCLKQEPNVNILWHDSRMMASHIRSTVSSFCNTASTILVRQSRSQNTERSVDVLHRSGKFWLQGHEKFSRNRTLNPTHCSDHFFRAQVVNVFDRRCGSGVPVFKLAPVGHEQLFSVISPGLSVPHISDDILQQIVSEASAAAQNRTSNV